MPSTELSVDAGEVGVGGGAAGGVPFLCYHNGGRAALAGGMKADMELVELPRRCAGRGSPEGDKGMIKIKRVYEAPAAGDGARVLVDRLWPRGVSKAAARLDLWLREIAPSDALRKWFGHDEARWEGFRERYLAELRGNAAAVGRLRELLPGKTVTLLYAARDPLRNNAAVLREFLAGPVKRARKKAA